MNPQLLQIARFALVGGVNTGTFYGCYLALHAWLPYYPAYVLAFGVSMVGSFFLNTYFTYRTRPTWRKFLLFPLTNLTNFVVTSVGVFVLVEWCGVGERIAPLLAAAAAIPVTYVLSRRILLTEGDPAADVPDTPAEPARPTPAPGRPGPG
ncbi:GtrA family protein [Streptomyces sp. NPDC088745]|uniref:GtrA family protein n=1 Tax=Streptomyces sp. NPDC088745 TaxID=3365884 RepID=UPI003812DCB0